MAPDELRGPQVDIVPFLFALYDVDAATVDALAASYCVAPERIEAAAEAARREGYVVRDDGLYSLTAAGQDATMVRGDWAGAGAVELAGPFVQASW